MITAFRARTCAMALMLMAAAAAAAACGDEEAATAEQFVVPDAAEIEASDETREALGVDVWGVSEDGDETFVRGYSASGKLLIELHQAIGYGEGAYHLLTKLEELGSDGTLASFTLETTDDLSGDPSEVRVANNTVLENARAKLILERIEADTDASDEASTEEEGTSLTTRTLTTRTLAPLANKKLVQSEQKKLIECVKTLIKQVQKLIKTVGECVLTQASASSASKSPAAGEGDDKAKPGDTTPRADTSGGSAAKPSSSCAEQAKEAVTDAKAATASKASGSASDCGDGGGSKGSSGGSKGSSSSGGSKGSSSSSSGSTSSSSGSSSGSTSSSSGSSSSSSGSSSGSTSSSSGSTSGSTGGSPPKNACEATDSPFTLPLPGGTTVFVSQGNDGQFSHNSEFSLHAFDFALKAGAALTAMADGTVVKINDATKPGMPCFDGGGVECLDKANFVLIRHADGNDSLYLHLESVSVKVGANVKRGDVVGRVGSTGHSTGPHAHVQLQNACETQICKTVPLVFGDVSSGGVPKSGDQVTACASE